MYTLLQDKAKTVEQRHNGRSSACHSYHLYSRETDNYANTSELQNVFLEENNPL